MAKSIATDVIKVTDLLKENKALRADVERLQAWVSDLKSGLYVNCAYCGHRYGPAGSAPVTKDKILRQHIEKCPQHPLAEVTRERDELLAIVKTLRGE